MAFDIRLRDFHTHESEKLNALLGKTVKITFWDYSTISGVLGKPKDFCGRYEIPVSGGVYRFYKSHIKKVEVL